MPKKAQILIISGLTLLFAATLVAILMTVILIGTEHKAGCRIYPFEVDPHPLVVTSGSSNFLYPNVGEKWLAFTSGGSVDFICPGQKVIYGQSETNSSVLSGNCDFGNTFNIGISKVHWKDIRCSGYALSSIRYTGNRCENNGTEIEVGFETGDNRFLRSYLICFNPKLQIAYYSYIIQPASINQRILDTRKPSFDQGSEIYDIDTVNNLYLRKNQKVTINRLLGLPDYSTKYIKDSRRNNSDFNKFLSRGHMTARGDGFYAAQQNSTYYFANAAPQWQSFNGYNWNQIEIDVREYGEKHGVDLHIWTGVHGVTTLPHENTKVPTELYLFVNETTNRKALPVPEIYWKVAYNPITERGIALIGVNNPYKSELKTMCDDVSQNITWLHFKRDNQQDGFCYACSIGTFRQVVTSMPNISDKGLLL